MCVWWRPWVSGRVAPHPQNKYAASSEEKVVVDRVWLQAYVQSDPQAQNFVNTLQAQPDEASGNASRGSRKIDEDACNSLRRR